jgi:hypothetical protein
LQAGNAIKRGRLAATGRPEQRNKFAALDVQGKTTERRDRLTFGVHETAADRIETQLIKLMLHGRFLGLKTTPCDGLDLIA